MCYGFKNHGAKTVSGLVLASQANINLPTKPSKEVFLKKRPKWFQQTSFNQPNTSDTSYCVFKNLYPSSLEDTTTEEISAQNITTDNKPSSNEMTKNDFLLEIHQFKQQKLYEEALSCIQLLFEKIS